MCSCRPKWLKNGILNSVQVQDIPDCIPLIIGEYVPYPILTCMRSCKLSRRMYAWGFLYAFSMYESRNFIAYNIPVGIVRIIMIIRAPGPSEVHLSPLRSSPLNPPYHPDWEPDAPRPSRSRPLVACLHHKTGEEVVDCCFVFSFVLPSLFRK